MSGWLRVLLAELPLLRDLPDFTQRPLPRIEAELGPAVPGWVLRAASVLVTGALVAIATQRTSMAAGLAWSLVGIASVGIAIWPASAVAQLAVVASGMCVAIGGHGPFDPVVFALIPLAYTGVRLAWWSERVPPAARIELAALTRGLPRGLAILSGTVGFGALVFLLAGRPNPIAVIAGGVALIALTWLAFVRLAPSSRTRG